MTVIRWNPLREIDDLFARAGHFPVRQEQRRAPPPAGFVPPADVSETQENYFIELELPGVAAEDVEVSLHDGVVTIAGHRANPFAGHAADHQTAEGTETTEQLPDDTQSNAAAGVAGEEAPRLHRSERRYGKFERRFRLPKDAEAEAVKAYSKDGVLRVSIGRRQEAARRAIEVQVA